MAMGSLMLGVIRRNLLMERGGSDRNLNGSDVNGEGGGTNEKLVDCQPVVERDKRDQDNAKERKISTRDAGI
jgi:hypothetical protein